MAGDDSNKKVSAEQEYALVLLIKEIFSQIDEIAAIKKQGGEARISQQMLREMCGVLRELEPPLSTTYLDLVVLLATKAELPTSSFSEDYAEIAKGAKERFISRIRSDLKLEAA